MARPTKYTDEIVNEIVGGVAVGLTDKDAALAAGISENTLHVWRRRYRDFDSRLMRARKQRSRLMLRRIHEAGKTDWKAAAELLDRTDREYRKTPLEITGKDGGPIQHEHRHEIEYAAFLSQLSDDDLAHERRMAELRARYQAGELVG